MEDGNHWPCFFRKQFKDFRCRTKERFEPLKYLVRFYRDGKTAVLPGPDEDDLRILFFQKLELVIGKRRVTIGFFEFPGFFLGTFCDGPVLVDDYIVIITYVIDLNPPVPCLQIQVTTILRIIGRGSHQVNRHISQ